jgi:hypothetical protein
VSWKNNSSGSWNTAVNWSNSALPTSADTVTIGFGSASNTFTVTENTANAAASTLTIDGDTQAPINHSVTLSMVGNTLTVNTSVSLSNDQSIISGFGTLSAGGNISGSGTITATGGALKLTGAGTLVSGPVLKIGTAPASTLEMNLTGGATVANTAFLINNANQTLKVDTKFTISGANETITLGTVQLAGGTLTDTSGITLSSGSLTGFGTVSTGTTTGADFDGAGTVLATGGVLSFAGRASSDSATKYQIADAAGSGLKFSNQVGSLATVTFLDAGATGGSGTLDLTGTNLANFQGTVGKFIVGDTVKVLNADHVTLAGGTTLNVFNASNASLGSIKLGESHTGFSFFVDKATGAITTDMPCFAAGSRILTATGERPVETLLQGDIVLTLADDELQAHPVNWVGRRRIDLTAHPRPETVAPIRIQRGAFADSMPHTDLLVSPDHAIFVDGRLICARQLVNGTTILQEQGWSSVEYYHVELDMHAILLAEGLPAESYLDTGNRGFFGNSDDPLILHPDLTDESDSPVREAGSCAPFVSAEPEVRPVWQRLADRAAALGQPIPQLDTTNDPAPCLIARGRTVKPMYGESGLYIFALPKGATEVRLVSRSAAPTDVRPWLEDRRRLGLYVERIVLRSADDVRELPVDHPGLSQGWWAVESHNTSLRRWTDGSAVLPLPDMAGPAMLEVRAGSAGLLYPLQSEPKARAA